MEIGGEPVVVGFADPRGRVATFRCGQAEWSLRRVGGLKYRLERVDSDGCCVIGPNVKVRAVVPDDATVVLGAMAVENAFDYGFDPGDIRGTAMTLLRRFYYGF